MRKLTFKRNDPVPVIEGFVAAITNLSDNIWSAKVSTKDVVYNSDNYGTVRLCPDSYSKIKSGANKPTTLNHTDTVNGVIMDGYIDKDGDPALRWRVDEDTNKMMLNGDWKGGISLSFVPLKLREDPEGIADWVATDWEVDALGIGDGSDNLAPACPTGICNPNKVEGMTNDGGTASAEETLAAKVAAAAKAEEEAKAAAEAKEKEQAELLTKLKAQSTEDAMKVFDSLLESRLTPLEQENKTLKEQLKEISESKENLEKFKKAEVEKQRIAIIAQLPADADVDYESKSLEQLAELKKLADKFRGMTPPEPEGEPQDIPEASSKTGGSNELGLSDEDVREYNRQRKARYQVKPKK